MKYREILEFNKKKNPSALQKDNQGQVKLNNDPKNKNKNPASIIKPGDKVELDANK